ncbi:MAG: D-alanyl-D-alanine carboxypeptidase, partial [Thiotrichales bacterium]|nr:D-alanyl-D-alanine carboxypeptidase [Thiotrichales bacterium]
MSSRVCLTFIIFTLLPLSLQAGAGMIPAAPGLNATSYLLMDHHSGQVLVEKDIHKRLPPASLTKMMTVYVAASELAENHLSMSDIVVVSEKAWRMPGSRMFIEVNKKVSVEDLLKGIIVQSGNDASVALAEYISGSEEVFANQMNEHARRLGMTNTHYTNSTGLPDEQHYTTAYDLAILAQALIRDFPELYAWHAIKEFTYNKIKQNNRNNLLWRDNSVDGIKTGHTEAAGYCLVASALRDDMRLISVVMGAGGSESRIKASQSIINYGFRFYET